MIPLYASTTTKRVLSAVSLALCAAGSAFALVAQAETTPTTKCVTPTTIAMRDAAVAQLEKDVAPYKEKTATAGAISLYRQELQLAWEAMEQPYCGYGSYGAKSAVHSYSKTVSRARSEFVTAAKSGKVVTPLPLSNAEVVTPSLTAKSISAAATTTKDVATTEVKKTDKVAVKTSAKKFAKKAVKKGLKRGDRSEDVKALQQRLVDHFNLTPADDYVTGYFGPTTYKLLVKYQLEKGIVKSKDDDACGLIGPKTVTKLNAE